MTDKTRTLAIQTINALVDLVARMHRALDSCKNDYDLQWYDADLVDSAIEESLPVYQERIN